VGEQTAVTLWTAIEFYVFKMFFVHDFKVFSKFKKHVFLICKLMFLTSMTCMCVCLSAQKVKKKTTDQKLIKLGTNMCYVETQEWPNFVTF